MGTDKAAERQKRYRMRQKLRAQALLAGGQEIPLAWFGKDADGEFVAFDENGNRLALFPRPPKEEPTKKKLYSPRGMPQEQYEAVIAQIKEQNASKEKTIESLRKAKDTKLGGRLIALVEALPEGPDWIDHFPAWTEG